VLTLLWKGGGAWGRGGKGVGINFIGQGNFKRRSLIEKKIETGKGLFPLLRRWGGGGKKDSGRIFPQGKKGTNPCARRIEDYKALSRTQEEPVSPEKGEGDSCTL